VSVNLILSRTKSATPNEIADTLAGGGVGVDFGQVTNGSYSGVVNQPANTHNDAIALFYLRHDAITDPITNLKFFIGEYNLTYGGALSAAADFNGANHGLVGEGAASGVSKNNSDANRTSSGLWMDMEWNASSANQFDYATRVNNVRIFGKALAGVTGSLATTNANGEDQNGKTGIDLDSGFLLSPDALIYSSDDVAETDASAPVKGYIGKNQDSVLGDYAKFRLRCYLRESYPDGGIIQFSFVTSYSFTS
jgi:hypothetical protein